MLRGAGYEAYFAGGCVRDMLLGRVAEDFDVATSATPDVVMGLFEKTFAVGAHFGVVLVCPGGGGAEIATEVATFRHDGAYSDGRRPDAVEFSMDAREDVLRRDFTINGMLMDPVVFEETGDAGGAVLDYVGGRGDLARGWFGRLGSRGYGMRRRSCGCCGRCGLRRGWGLSWRVRRRRFAGRRGRFVR